MAISWNEIKNRAIEFSRDWKGETREHAEAKSFWDAFFHVFGISRRRVASFEEPVKKLNDNYGFIDLFWKGTLLVEHKSKGKDLDKAYSQALEYFAGLKEHELPKYVLVSDFERFCLYDLEENAHHEFHLKDFHKKIRMFGFIAGYTQKKYKDEEPVNIAAAEKMGKLHDKLLESGYAGHELEVLLMRLLFCLFADDTAIFDKNLFTDYIRDKTSEDGSDLGAHLTSIFQTLNTEPSKRQKNLDESLNDFPYVNGGLFEENLRTVFFDSAQRDAFLDCCNFNWSNISPAIFGSMFQSVMDPQARRNIGAHYTTEKNILKLIGPLFLDELRAEFEHIRSLKTGKNKRLEDFHKKLATLKFFDPACGCGNFLVITYRELRRLEIEILEEIHNTRQQVMGQMFSLVNVEQFYGIEIEEFPARIAETAMWLMDHQMNVELAMAVDVQRPSLPLVKSAHILNGNALRVDWAEFAPKDEINYILGNPPFIGHHLQSVEQKKEQHQIWEQNSCAGVMDYVTNWYIKAAQYIQDTDIKVAFVSTNSITMGEQVGILWNELNKYNIKIHFAHRTFSWSSEARGAAAVHVVIIGFAAFDTNNKIIFEYEDIKGEPHQTIATNINPYLANAADIMISNRAKPICNVPAMKYGSKPTDGGHFIFTESEKNEFVKLEPNSKKCIRPYTGAVEFIGGYTRYCLWLVDISPAELRSMPEVVKRVSQVREFRLNSKAATTRKSADTATLFRQIAQPDSNYIIVPSVSSEKRKYIPMGFMSPEVIVSNLCFTIPNTNLYHFGILTSWMHMAWIKYTCGRLKSDYRYSKDIVYNNYPWPKDVSEKQVAAVEAAAQDVLDARAKFPDSSLADLYDPLTMPAELVKAHNALDKAVDKCYRGAAFNSETERLEYLFGLYNEYTKPLIKDEPKPKRRKKVK